jgi:hypothetical protein
MLKWLRNKIEKPIYLDCYTTNADVYNTARLKAATYYYPQWWKRLLPTVDRTLFDSIPGLKHPASTMRHCVGFTDLFKKSFCLPLWSDLVIHVEPAMREGYAWKFADGRSNLTDHPAFQRGDFMPPEHFQHVKINSPWQLRCSEEINFLFFDPFWPSYEGEETVIIPPGILNFQHQSATNINLFVRKMPDEPRKVELKFNTPIVFITPLTERRVILRHHLATPQEMVDITRPQVSFVDSYLRAKKAKVETTKQAKKEQSND